MMGDGVVVALDEAIERTVEVLKSKEPGSKEYNEVLKEYDTLLQKRLEFEQNEIKAFQANEQVRLEGLKAEAEQNHKELLLDFEKEKLEAEQKKNADMLELEKEKLETNSEIERKKAGLTPGKAIIELLKVVVPVITTIIGYRAYDRFQNKNLEFEQEHVFKATTTKDLRMSNILPKR